MVSPWTNLLWESPRTPDLRSHIPLIKSKKNVRESEREKERERIKFAMVSYIHVGWLALSIQVLFTCKLVLNTIRNASISSLSGSFEKYLMQK